MPTKIPDAVLSLLREGRASLTPDDMIALTGAGVLTDIEGGRRVVVAQIEIDALETFLRETFEAYDRFAKTG